MLQRSNADSTLPSTSQRTPSSRAIVATGLSLSRYVRAVVHDTTRTLDSDKPVATIARELGVRWLVEGSVLSAFDRWSIAIRIVDAHDDRVVLSHRFACGARDVLHLQAEITEAVTGHLLFHPGRNL